jgi:hypothetical protein
MKQATPSFHGLLSFSPSSAAMFLCVFLMGFQSEARAVAVDSELVLLADVSRSKTQQTQFNTATRSFGTETLGPSNGFESTLQIIDVVTGTVSDVPGKVPTPQFNGSSASTLTGPLSQKVSRSINAVPEPGAGLGLISTTCLVLLRRRRF